MSMQTQIKFAIRAVTNVHVPGNRPDIFLFATPRGGSTWLMEILASQPGIKFFDEPLSPRRENVAHSGLFPGYESLMPETGDASKIIAFLKDLQRGRHSYMNVTPFRRNHRFFTNRCVFKIHEIEHLIQRVEDECRGQVVYLLRHPVATSISRDALPRLDLFLDSDYYKAFVSNPEKLARIRLIARSGSRLQKAVISWCFENMVVLRNPGPNWLVLTYEEMVLNPARACDLLLARLDLKDRDAMMTSFERPAVNIAMSRADTLAAMNNRDARQRRRKLVTKWLDRVTGEQLAEADEILHAFGVDAYEPRKVLARPRYLHFADTAEAAEV